MPKKRPHYKHTLPRLARSTPNELQQNQHEKASLVCVRVLRTEPVRTGIGAVCVEYGRPTWPITMLNYTYIQKNVLFLFLAPYARTTRYEEAFLLEGNKRPHY